MGIRLATVADIPTLNQLLQEILLVHHKARPDIFRSAGQKFSSVDLAEMMENPETPIYVYEKEGQVLGHMFCQKTQTHSSLLEPFKNFFIEDLCVTEKARGQKIGQKLYDFAVELAKKEGCHNLTLDVWDDNQAAKAFYEKQGLQAQKTRMELRLD